MPRTLRCSTGLALLAVACADPAATTGPTPSPDAARRGSTNVPLVFIVGAGGLVADGRGSYEGGKCGVRAHIVDGVGDAVLGPSLDWSRKTGCVGGPRVLTVAYADASDETVRNLAIYDLGTVETAYDPAASTEATRVGQAGLNTNEGACGLVTWGIEKDSPRLAITPTATGWDVSTTGDHKAWCSGANGGSGELRVVPFTMTVVRQ